MNKNILIILFLIFALLPIDCLATNSSDVVVNEIAWMGTTASANDEWLELYNNTSNPITLDGWALKANDGTPDIKLAGTISANGFYLLERTDDTTVPNIKADLIYKGALGNSGEDLWLYDGNNNLIDEVNCTEKWFAGDNATKQTMERISRGPSSGDSIADWQISESPGGTPKTENSTGAVAKAEPTPVKETPVEAPVATETPLTYPTGVILNEILPSPEGADDQNEWIELYNTNNFEVDLSGWKIKDKDGSITNYSLPENTKISAYGYLVFKRPNTKITLNNTTDGLFLYWPNEKIIDSMAFEKAPVNQSYNKIGSSWQWSASLTPGAKNIIVQNNAGQGAGDLSKIKKSGNSKEIDKSLSAISQSTNQDEIKNTSPWFLFFTAIIITIISAILVLFIKFKLHPVK